MKRLWKEEDMNEVYKSTFLRARWRRVQTSGSKGEQRLSQRKGPEAFLELSYGEPRA